MASAYTRAGLVAGGHTAQQAARRDQILTQICELLKTGPMSCFDLSAKLRIPSSTVYGYLTSLQDLGEVYRMDALDDRGRKTYALDEKAQQIAAARALTEHARRALIVPARQIGMSRHWMDVALFGPARRAA